MSYADQVAASAGVSWTDALQGIGAIATPIVVAVLVYVLSRYQSRSQELLKVRLDYYGALMPDLNTLMCYMTFIGTWRDISPLEIVALKRRLDQNLYCAAPLFDEAVLAEYERFMKLCFETFTDWGEDAKIRSNAFRRRENWCRNPGWQHEWDNMFELDDRSTIPSKRMQDFREVYDTVVAAIVKDLNIARARPQYTTDRVSLNAHAPAPRDIVGSAATRED